MADVENDNSIVLVGADDEPEVAVDNNNDVGDDGDVAFAVASPIPRKRGRATSEIWGYFNMEKSPSQSKSAICQHCQMRVNYHKKSESVVVHLNRCAPFKALMNGMAISDRPEWYQGPKKTWRSIRHHKSCPTCQLELGGKSGFNSIICPAKG
jgi:hypothetical protein